jgi:hypothetical protein
MQVSDGRRLAFVAEIAVAEQISSALGRMAKELRQPGPQTVIAEPIAEYTVQLDAFGEAVILRLVTPHGVPHTFALPADTAAEIGARLKTESEKKRNPGRA